MVLFWLALLTHLSIMNNCKKKGMGKKFFSTYTLSLPNEQTQSYRPRRKAITNLLSWSVQFSSIFFFQQWSKIQLIGLSSSSSSLSSWLSRQNNTSKLLFREYSRKKALTCESKYLSCGCRCLSCSCSDCRRLKAKLVTTAQRELFTCQDLGPGNTEFLQNTSAASLYTVAKLSTRFLWSNARRRVKRT